MDEQYISVRHLTKSFGNCKVVDDLSFDVKKGEVLALIGKPEIVFLDELTTGLDVVARREVWRTLKQLKEQTACILEHFLKSGKAISMVSGIKTMKKNGCQRYRYQSAKNESLRCYYMLAISSKSVYDIRRNRGGCKI